MFSEDQAHPEPTFTSPQNGATTRIDAIFTSPNFPFTPLYYHTRKSFLYLTDHYIVAAYFQLIELARDSRERRLRNKRKVYNVSSMDESDWRAFAEYSKKYYKEHNYKRYETLSNNKHHLNVL